MEDNGTGGQKWEAGRVTPERAEEEAVCCEGVGGSSAQGQAEGLAEPAGPQRGGEAWALDSR